MKGYRGDFDRDARNVIGLIGEHLPSAEVIWAYGQGPEPTAAELRKMEEERERQMNAEIASTAALARRAETLESLCLAYVRCGHPDSAEKYATQAHHTMKEAARAAYQIALRYPEFVNEK